MFPTSDEKLLLLASQALQQRAYGQDAILASTLLNTFRTKKIMDEILTKSKAILAAEAGFFQGPDARPRWSGRPKPNELLVAVDSFVKEQVEHAEGGIMTLGECLLQLGKTSAISANKKGTDPDSE